MPKLRAGNTGPAFNGLAGGILQLSGALNTPSEDWEPVPLAAVLGVLGLDQNSNAYTQISGQPTIIIATVSIPVQEGSRLLIMGLASITGSVAPGRAFASTPQIASLVASQSFGTAVGSNFTTLNYLGVTDELPAGTQVVDFHLDVNGNAGARVDDAGKTCLFVQELVKRF